MAEVTVTIDRTRADTLRRMIALEWSSAAENLYRAAGDYSLEDQYLDSFRAAAEANKVWAELLETLGWESPAASQSRTLVAPREHLQSVCVLGLRASAERLEEVDSRKIRTGELRQPSEVASARVEDMRLFEDLLDQVGWPEAEEGGG